MDRTMASEAVGPGSIPGGTTTLKSVFFTGARTSVRQQFHKSFSRGEHVKKLLKSDKNLLDLLGCAEVSDGVGE